MATALAVPVGCIAFLSPAVGVSIPFLFLFQVMAACFFGATFATILELSPLRMRGSIVTYTTLIMNLGGYGLGPQITGGLSDLYGAAGITEPLPWALASASVLMATASVCFYIAGRRMQREATAD